MNDRSRLAGVLAGTTVLAGSLLVTATASAQCTVNPNPDFTQNDGGCPVTGQPDPNGGCNQTPSAFQATGTISSATPSFTIGGTTGASEALGSRDLDWYSFTVTEACFINLTLVMTNTNGTPAGDAQMFFGRPDDCGSFGGFQFGACPAAFPEQFVQPGTYGVVVTRAFATAAVPDTCNSPYTITVSARFSQYPECGSASSGGCGIATPGTGGCQDVGCCDFVCNIDPLCCAIQWDATCAATAQLAPPAGCGIFVYVCNPPANAPANDCATSAQITGFDAPASFNNANATTDGPNNGQCAVASSKDIWYLVQAPSNGNMTIVANTPGQDIVVSVYANGNSSTVNGSQLSNNYIGCVNAQGAGGEAVILTGTTGGEWYLWRIGQVSGTGGAGTVEFGFERVIWDTGIHVPICDANGGLVNLGLSSGAISATLTQRWMAVPFSVEDPDGAGPQTSWNLSLMQPEGFQPAATVNERLNWIIWSRNGFVAPNYATDQVASGQVPYPAALGPNGEADIPMDLDLPAGDYYLTVFASAVGNPCRPNDGQQSVFSNFAWFVGAPNGLIGDTGSGPFGLRSVTMPGSGPADEIVIAGTSQPCEGGTGGGFTPFFNFAGQFNNCAGQDPGQFLRNAFRIFGSPIEASGPACPTDIDGDGVTGASDLSTLLNGWGTSSPDLDGDGIVGASDLSTLLNGWGACP